MIILKIKYAFSAFLCLLLIISGTGTVGTQTSEPIEEVRDTLQHKAVQGIDTKDTVKPFTLFIKGLLGQEFEDPKN